MGPVALAVAQTRFKNSRILLIDEASMVGSLMLGMVDVRLRDIMGVDKPFGGLGVILMGDFWQLPCVGDMSLPSAALRCRSSNFAPQDALKNIASLPSTGAELFQQFRMFKFSKQMRVDQADQEHATMVSSFQSTTANPLTRQFLSHLSTKHLTPQRIAADPSWSEATIIVPTNKQRLVLLPRMVVHFALKHSLPVLRWRYPIPHASALTEQEKESLYVRFPALSGFFIKGAPAFLTSNINPHGGLANGSMAVLHSLSWDNQDHVSSIRHSMSIARPGQIIDVDLPFTVNIEMPVIEGGLTSLMSSGGAPRDPDHSLGANRPIKDFNAQQSTADFPRVSL
jgi:hypothetical protein